MSINLTEKTKVRSLNLYHRKKIRSASPSASSFPENQEDIKIANPFPNPTVQILSPPITRVTLRGRLNLECVVREDPPNSVWWWLNGTKLDLGAHRGLFNIC